MKGVSCLSMEIFQGNFVLKPNEAAGQSNEVMNFSCEEARKVAEAVFKAN